MLFDDILHIEPHQSVVVVVLTNSPVSFVPIHTYIPFMMILQSLSQIIPTHYLVRKLIMKQKTCYKALTSKVFETRYFSSNHEDTINIKKRETNIQIIGNKTEYDAIKQLRLIQMPDEFNSEPNLLASMHVKRNIIFGTRIHDYEYLAQIGGKKLNEDVISRDADARNDDSDLTLKNFDEKFGFVKVCKPLLVEALQQASKEGDQPQGLAALTGLCDRVQYLIRNPSESDAMLKLRSNAFGENSDEEGKILLEAIQSVATQIPRSGHEVVGIGTYFDSRKGWTELAKEYALARRGLMIVQGESQLFQSNGAVLVGIEYIGKENPKYWIDAGGAMARFVFV